MHCYMNSPVFYPIRFNILVPGSILIMMLIRISLMHQRYLISLKLILSPLLKNLRVPLKWTMLKILPCSYQGWEMITRLNLSPNMLNSLKTVQIRLIF